MTPYQTLKRKHQEEFNAFEGVFWAFSNEQFKKGVAKLGLPPDANPKDHLYALPGGGFILKTRSKDLDDLFARQEQERKDLKKDQKNLLEALVYELQNHEYCITYSTEDALNMLGLKKEDVDPALLKKACKLALEGVTA